MTRTRTTAALPALAAAASLALASLAGPAHAAPDSGDRVVLASSVMPLQLAVGSDGTVYVAQNAAGVLTAVPKKGDPVTVATATGSRGEMAGVDAKGKGTLTYTTTTSTGEEPNVSWLSGELHRALPNGRTSRLADLLGYERSTNPDASQSYGLSGASASCLAQLPPPVREMLAPYTGIEDSHAYSVLLADDGSRIVADAGANTLFRVAPNGRTSTLTVFPGTPIVLDEGVLEDNGLGDFSCLEGATYTSEAVPTDVEQGPDGQLYVTTLSGGIAPGAVWRVDPATGAATRLASGFVGAVNLAVADDGTIYVSELFGGRIARLRDGVVTTAREVASPGGLEWSKGRLYVGTDVFGSGKVISFVP